MNCKICNKELVIYKDSRGKYINYVKIENYDYGVCSRCLRKILFSNLMGTISPVSKNGVSSKDIIEQSEQMLNNNHSFDDYI